MQISTKILSTKLSVRELEVLRLIKKGKTNREIAQLLNISFNTVKTHVDNIFGKLNVKNRTQAAMKAIQKNI
jgi:DNA-binding NarL/FixJ family response regulator